MLVGRPRKGFTLIELLVVIAIIAILIALLVPAVQKVREAAARTQSQNNMRQLAIAIHSFHDVFKAFPKGTNGNPGTNGSGNWIRAILPYVEQLKATPTASILTVLVDPSDPNNGKTYNNTYGLTSYLAVCGSGSSYTTDGLITSVKVSMPHVTDGTSNTLMIGPRPPTSDGYWGWWDSATFRDAVLSVGTGTYAYRPGNLASTSDIYWFWAPQPQGGSWAMGDASVRFISYTASSVLPRAATRNGGETGYSIDN